MVVTGGAILGGLVVGVEGRVVRGGGGGGGVEGGGGGSEEDNETIK